MDHFFMTGYLQEQQDVHNAAAHLYPAYASTLVNGGWSKGSPWFNVRSGYSLRNLWDDIPLSRCENAEL